MLVTCQQSITCKITIKTTEEERKTMRIEEKEILHVNKGSMNTLCYYNIQYNADLLLDSVVRYSND